MKAVADTLGVARSNLVKQLRHPARPRRGPYTRAEDNEVIAEIRTITDARPTYGNRRHRTAEGSGQKNSGKTLSRQILSRYKFHRK